MPWATAADVFPLLAADLGVEVDQMASAWTGRLAMAVPQGRREVETALDARAYSPGQIAACDWLFDEHAELSLVHAAIKGGTLTGYDLGALEARLARIVARLKAQPIYIGGVPVWPARTEPGGQGLGVAGGAMAAGAELYDDPTRRPPWNRKIDPNEGY